MIGRTTAAAPLISRSIRGTQHSALTRTGAVRNMGHNHRVFEPPYEKGSTVFWWSFTVFVPIYTTFWAIGFQQRKQGFWK